MITPRELKKLYAAGENISALLRDSKGLPFNTEEIIEMSYDLQAGSYIEAMQDSEKREHKEAYSRGIADVIRSLCDPSSVLEAGVGEATTFSGVLKNLGREVKGYGFDLSWSRIARAQEWLRLEGIVDAVLCTGSLLQIPFADDSIDVVYTSHSIEPNGGREEPILRELYRVARRYLILLEPGYELGSPEARARMDSHGYCKGLKDLSEKLGFRVLAHRLFPLTANPLNPTAITVIEKTTAKPSPSHVLACPRYGTILEEIGGMMFSPEALVVYPVVGEIPCLRTGNGICAGEYREVMAACRNSVSTGKV